MATGRRRALAPVDGGLSLHSEALGLEVRLDEDGRLRFHDPESGEDLPAHEKMRERVEQEIAARRAAEARLDETETRLGETEARLRETRARLDEGTAAHREARARLEEAGAERDARIARIGGSTRPGPVAVATTALACRGDRTRREARLGRGR